MAVLAIICVLVLFETAVFFSHALSLRSLHRLAAPEPKRWPRLSVIIAARDEAQNVSDSVASRLADDYPNLEVILVAGAVGPPWHKLLGAVTLAVYTFGEVVALWKNTRMWAPAMLWPVGFATIIYGAIRATWLAHRNGGIWWRDTFYSLDELTKGRRLKL